MQLDDVGWTTFVHLESKYHGSPYQQSQFLGVTVPTVTIPAVTVPGATKPRVTVPEVTVPGVNSNMLCIWSRLLYYCVGSLDNDPAA